MHPAVLSIAHLFESSNVERLDWDKYGRVLEVVLQDHGLSTDEIVAVSQPSFELLVVWRTGHITANERGVFKKRIEAGKPVSYQDGIHLVRGQKGVRGRDGMLIEGFSHGSSPLFELSWDCGGPVSESDAADERDRIFNIMQPLVN